MAKARRTGLMMCSNSFRLQTEWHGKETRVTVWSV